LGNGRYSQSRFILDRPPTVGQPTAGTNPETGVTTLSANAPAGGLARAAQEQGSQFKWYLGDGTTATGQSVTHRFQPGDYVITVEIRDQAGCATRLVMLLHAPASGNPTLSRVDWCDPLGGGVRFGDQSVYSWPPDVGANQQSKAAPVMVTLGRHHDAGAPGFAVAFGFEVRVTVVGDPAKCTSGQVIRSRYWWEADGKQEEYISPAKSGSYASDGYGADYTGRFRTVQPAADGTSTIAWLDFPGVLYSKDAKETRAEVMATFVSYVHGQEAPISHSETEGSGEAAFLHFKVCAAWNQPSGTRDSNFDVLGAGAPDAALPAQAAPPLAPQDDVYQGPAKNTMKGCGPK
jgi:hypothetical protein